MSAIGGSKIEAAAFFCAVAFADRGGNASKLSGRFGE
jgi:hypothetical protein